MAIRTQSNALYSLRVPCSGLYAHTCMLRLGTQGLHQHTANAVLDVPPTCAQVPAANSAIQASCEDHCLGGMAPDVYHSLHYQDLENLNLAARAQGKQVSSRSKRERNSQGPPQDEDMFL